LKSFLKEGGDKFPVIIGRKEWRGNIMPEMEGTENVLSLQADDSGIVCYRTGRKEINQIGQI
jgi:hypothetical protein